ncbi:MAG: cell division protein FtsZ, partial [Pseudomonadota bacterium]
GVTDLMVRPGLINLDFADVRAVMDEMGKAMMGTGEAEGEERAIQAAEKAIANPLLDEISLRGAKGVLINITGAHDLTLFELDEAANRIREEVDPDANIIVGSTLDSAMEGRMRVSVVATGIDASEDAKEVPTPRRRMAEPLTLESARQVAEPVVEPEHAPEEAPAHVASAAAEPGLFDGHAAEAQAHAEDTALDVAEDHLPAPAYTPERTPSPAAHLTDQNAQPEFVAPKSPSWGAPAGAAPAAERGAPTPEAMARLQAAVGKVRGDAPAAAEPAASAEPAPSGRLRISSFINRMSGQGGEGPSRAEPSLRPDQRSEQPPAPQHRVSATHYEEDDPSGAEQERIEIPAFLRRQAN